MPFGHWCDATRAPSLSLVYVGLPGIALFHRLIYYEGAVLLLSMLSQKPEGLFPQLFLFSIAHSPPL